LPPEKNINAPRNGSFDQPPKPTPKIPPSNPITPASTKNSCLDVAVGRAQGLEYSDFSPSLENGHHQRVDDAERGDGQRQAAENRKQKIQNFEKEAEIARDVEQGKAEKPMFLMAVSIPSTCEGPFARTVKLA